MPDLLETAAAVVSPCGLYRYRLSRTWGGERPAVFVMLNPSTADAAEDDPTIRRCIGFARQWHCGGLIVVNLFAFRATSPKDLFAAADPVGPDNLKHVFRAAQDAGQFIACAWGAHGAFRDQDIAIVRCIRRATEHAHLLCLGTTRDGHPRHPLYLPKTAELQLFQPRDGGGDAS